MSRDLPIYEVEEALVEALRGQPERPRLVLEAPTGSGKSTQTPQMLLDRGLLGLGQAVVLQPRRVAARMLARRVAEERGCRVGEEVGYQVRFENHAGPGTRIRYVTEGVLLRQILEDPSLSGVSAIVFDEFHERHFFGDVTLARAVQIQRESRPDLAILVTSATLDGEQIQAYLGDCPRLGSQGRTFPVEIRYAPVRERQKGEIWDHIARIAKNLEDPGDCLVFLPGAYEIRKTCDALRRSVKGADVLPLFGEQNPREQDRAIRPSSGSGPGERRKIVVATNVAETSLTIGGVTTVIDSGLARMADYDVRRGINTLTVQKISRASADQRAGRAGRTAPGTCIRLWSEEDHARRPAQTTPEIHRMDLAEVVLTLLVSGVENLDDFEWFERPDEAGLERATQFLAEIGALDELGAGHEAGAAFGEVSGYAALRPRAGGRRRTRLFPANVRGGGADPSQAGFSAQRRFRPGRFHRTGRHFRFSAGFARVGRGAGFPLRCGQVRSRRNPGQRRSRGGSAGQTAQPRKTRRAVPGIRISARGVPPDRFPGPNRQAPQPLQPRLRRNRGPAGQNER